MSKEITKKNKQFWEERARNNTFFTAGSPINPTDPAGVVFGKYRNRSEFNHIKNKIELKDKLVLDLGCGTGRLAFQFAKYCKKVVGVDFAPSMIEKAKEYAKENQVENVDFFVSDLQSFTTNYMFDIIYIGGVLMCIEDEDVNRIIQNFKKFLKKDGIIINRDTISLTNERKTPKIFNRKDRTDFAVYRTIDEIENLFKPEYSSCYISETYPFVLAQNIFNRLPFKLKKNKIILFLYNIGLIIQSFFLDSFLLRNKKLYKSIKENWKKSDKPVRQFYLFFKFNKNVEKL